MNAFGQTFIDNIIFIYSIISFIERRDFDALALKFNSDRYPVGTIIAEVSPLPLRFSEWSSVLTL